MANREQTLRFYKHLPVYVEEDHNEVVPHIHRAIASRHLPLKGIPFIHLDSHPDLLIPFHMPADDVFNKEKLYSWLSIENWILPLAYAGHMTEIYWLKPPWSNQIIDGTYSFVVGKCKKTGKLRMSGTHPYFVTEALFLHESEMMDAKPVTLLIITITPEDWKDHSDVILDLKNSAAKGVLHHDMKDDQAHNQCSSRKHFLETSASADPTTIKHPRLCAGNLFKCDSNFCSGNCDCVLKTHLVPESALPEDVPLPGCMYQKKSPSNENFQLPTSLQNASEDVSESEQYTHNFLNMQKCNNMGCQYACSSITLDQHKEESSAERMEDPCHCLEQKEINKLKDGVELEILEECGDPSFCSKKGAHGHNIKVASTWKGCFAFMQEKLQGKPYILDIDLDFFSTRNPFCKEFTPEQTLALREVFGYTLPGTFSDQLLADFTKTRATQLEELERVFEELQKEPQTRPIFKDVFRQVALDKLLQSLNCNNSINYEMVYQAGCTMDDTELPHHVSSWEQIEQLLACCTYLCQRLPPPTVVTIARSSTDDYCPQDQVDAIQSAVLSFLSDVYHDIEVKMCEQ